MPRRCGGPILHVFGCVCVGKSSSNEQAGQWCLKNGGACFVSVKHVHFGETMHAIDGRNG